MKVIVDSKVCSGQGQCFAAASSVYGLDESGFAAIRDEPIVVPAGLEQDAMLGLMTCPEQAIREV